MGCKITKNLVTTHTFALYTAEASENRKPTRSQYFSDKMPKTEGKTEKLFNSCKKLTGQICGHNVDHGDNGQQFRFQNLYGHHDCNGAKIMVS